MDAGTITAVGGAVVAVGGTIFTYLNRNRDSSDHRIDSAFQANQELLDDYRTKNEQLAARVDKLESDRDEDRKELGRQRQMLAEQSLEVFILRQRDQEMRGWAADILAWCAMAIGLIRGAGLEIPTPPPLPKVYSTDV